MTSLDINGDPTTINPATYIYNITFTSIRPSSDFKKPAPLPAAGIIVENSQAHSVGLSGSYSIKVNGVLLKVYNNKLGISST
jgi:hypothetical protein